jgi:hypothetical protein
MHSGLTVEVIGAFSRLLLALHIGGRFLAHF